MNSREQFEAWHKGLKAMLIAAGEPTAARHCENLKVVYENAWIASREAVEIELPQRWSIDGFESGWVADADGANLDYAETVKAIEASGLKVKA